MKTGRVPVILLAILYALFAVYFISTAGRLPARMATHFDLSGHPNGWMGRSAFLLFDGALAVGLPLFLTGMCYLARFMPAWMVNIPNREYWLTTDRRAATSAYLLRQAPWFACLMVGLVLGLHYLVVRANETVPAQLPLVPFLGLMACFVAGSLAWAVTIHLHFRHKS